LRRSLALLLMLILLGACGRGPGSDESAQAPVAGGDSTAVAEESGPDDEEEAAIPVEVVALGTGPIESVLRATSTLEAETRVRVIAEASRRVVELLVEEGDQVSAGKLLVRLQDAEQTSALAKAQTLFDQAERERQRQERLK
jgi:membrane fusion protein (multidrug efflux system)